MATVEKGHEMMSGKSEVGSGNGACYIYSSSPIVPWFNLLPTAEYI